MDSYIYGMGQVHLGWAKLSWIVHGVFNPWILGNERSWVLGLILILHTI